MSGQRLVGNWAGASCRDRSTCLRHGQDWIDRPNWCYADLARRLRDGSLTRTATILALLVLGAHSPACAPAPEDAPPKVPNARAPAQPLVVPCAPPIWVGGDGILEACVPNELARASVGLRVVATPAGGVATVHVTGKLPPSSVRCIERRAQAMELLSINACSGVGNTDFLAGFEKSTQ